MRELITAKEAAKRLGVHPRTIGRAIKQGIYKQEPVCRMMRLVWENGGLVSVSRQDTDINNG